MKRHRVRQAVRGATRSPTVAAMTRRILLQAPAPDDESEFLARARSSRKLHHPWVSPPGTAAQYHAWLERAGTDNHCVRLVRERATGAIAGAFIISQIVRGPFRSAYLGYYAFEGFQGRGLMAEGLRGLLGHAFGPLRLHRLEANIQPGNAASIALVRACGFRQEGYSPRYLKIGGRWRDHERWAALAD